MNIDFYKIRSVSKGRTESFEELSCQIFYREFRNDSFEYHRYRGDGGDGGVESVFLKPDGSKIALQSKYWESRVFSTSQVGQLSKSIDAAVANHPEITQYFISIPFNLTGKVSGESRGKSQTQKFEEWRLKKEQEHSVRIVLWGESILTDLLLKVDSSGGLRKYWFDNSIINDDQYEQHLKETKAQAGRRYTPKLSLKVPLSAALDTFTKKSSFVNWYGK